MLPKAVSAYYYIPDEPALVVRLKVDATVCSTNDFTPDFAVYAEDDLSTSDEALYIVPHSSQYVAADVVAANLSLYLSMQKPIRTDSALSSVLYANLKLIQLLELYENLQKRAADLLSGFPAPTVESNLLPAANDMKSAGSVSQKSETLKAGYNSIARQFNSQSINSSSGQVEKVSSVHTETLSAVLNRIRLSESTSTDATESRLLLVGGEAASSVKGTDGQGSISLSDRSVGDTSLNRFFEVGIKIVMYFLSHKMEAVFFLGVLVVLIMLFSSVRR